MIDAIFLVIFVHEKDRLHGQPAYEWLLTRARGIGIGGGSVFRAVAGFGRHGRLHEDRFFELSGEQALQVEFVVDRAQAEALLQEVKAAGASFPYMEQVCRFAMTDA